MFTLTNGDPPTISVAVGITVGLVTSFIQSAGLTMQRKSHLMNESLPEEEKRPERKRPLWLIGFAIFITSNILGSVFQIASLPVVILAPLGAVSLLWNALFAKILLGDVFSRYMVLGTVLIAGGAVLIAIFGTVPEPTHSLEDLLKLFSRHTFVVYFSLLGSALGIILIVTHIAESRIPAEFIYDSPTLDPMEIEGGERAHELEESQAAASTERTPLLMMDNKSQTSLAAMNAHEKRIARTKMWVAISFASASGILSGMCLLFAKSGVELLVLTITGDNQFFRWESWMLVGGLVVFALLQLWYMHKSLILADPTLVCPLAFCFYNLSSIFNGLVYYDQFALLSPLKLSMVLLGITILLLGVWAVSMQPSGGSRVEVGTWQEGAEVLTAEVTGTESAVVTSGLTESPPSSPTHIRRRSRPYARGVTTDAVPQLFLSTSPGSADLEREREEDVSPLLHDTHPSTTTTTPFPSVRSPTTRGTRPGRYGAGSELGHGHGLGSPTSPDAHHAHRARRKWSSIFETPAGTTAGLSIGLSATSPGFALVPSERRRVSSATYSIDSMGRARRTVSESDVRRRPSLDHEHGGSLSSPGVHDSTRLSGYGAITNAPSPSQPPHARASAWGRIRGLFKR